MGANDALDADPPDLQVATETFAKLMQLPEFAAQGTAGLALCALKDEPPNVALAQELVAKLHADFPADLSKPEVRRAISTVELQAGADREDGAPSVAALRDA